MISYAIVQIFVSFSLFVVSCWPAEQWSPCSSLSESSFPLPYNAMISYAIVQIFVSFFVVCCLLLARRAMVTILRHYLNLPPLRLSNQNNCNFFQKVSCNQLQHGLRRPCCFVDIGGVGWGGVGHVITFM